ncbi:MAG: hypothetical protein HY275_00295 [Gemmatimonadetes bacterium]|nr:hypothetical protein [Gemmatimonadota bacterium]
MLLLAVVAASGDAGIARARLTALFWPESDESRARNALKQAMFALRRELGAELFADGATVRLDPHVITSDVGDLFAAAAVRDAAAVVALATAPFLDAAFAGDSMPLDEWLSTTRQRVEDATNAAWLQLADGALAQGDRAMEARHLATLVARKPLDADLVVRLIRALAAAGNVTEALRQADEHARTMARDLQLPPDPAVLAAVARRVHSRTRPRAAGRATASPRHHARHRHAGGGPRRSGTTLDRPRIRHHQRRHDHALDVPRGRARWQRRDGAVGVRHARAARIGLPAGRSAAARLPPAPACPGAGPHRRRECTRSRRARSLPARRRRPAATPL